ncbi:Sua5/YciO/YrdC/YwlC family protein [Allofrancisella guangzhouensis]|uniref:L-threonylcarbamoyladenylate synthase n=1 Tax=Allofrancisella guangzhouensis TaxID=594679 RepID=A0A0A8E368_9GAMM|nr:Sua5/YciO/YrdC/YwlC family protein [Allofrancisella guangzhouensis]AJC48458.1 translation factor Sua5 [Allofrancisella guangzhouensis]MBK2027640.1 Sua5/YciO/YrdC/YwlC family protein [Allofrancisella guangzhouensis]MBK2044032.1 Sua5/YciO/YrdC/YwlC family protein [Allofrancisella guangzhouensis]MBK2046495.1 Sua5/YciO/YrdC/YwlC family protein [Allofrancisella guangzhouensis]
MLTKDINKIIAKLAAQEVVSVPTDTVYGLSCIIEPKVVDRLIKTKQRDSSKGFIIISYNFEHFLEYIDKSILSEEQLEKISTVQNTPTTWLVPAMQSIKWLTGEKPTVAIRLVKTKVIKGICNKLNRAIISTSANISGKPPLYDAKLIDETFKDITVFAASNKTSGTPSKIIDIINNEQIR